MIPGSAQEAARVGGMPAPRRIGNEFGERGFPGAFLADNRDKSLVKRNGNVVEPAVRVRKPDAPNEPRLVVKIGRARSDVDAVAWFI